MRTSLSLPSANAASQCRPRERRDYTHRRQSQSRLRQRRAGEVAPLRRLFSLLDTLATERPVVATVHPHVVRVALRDVSRRCGDDHFKASSRRDVCARTNMDSRTRCCPSRPSLSLEKVSDGALVTTYVARDVASPSASLRSGVRQHVRRGWLRIRLRGRRSLWRSGYRGRARRSTVVASSTHCFTASRRKHSRSGSLLAPPPFVHASTQRQRCRFS